MANHGALTPGADVVDAYHKMESLEHAAKIVLVSKLVGEPNLLSLKEVERLLDIRERDNLSGIGPGQDIYGKQEPASKRSAGSGPGAGRARRPVTDEENPRSLVERITREVLNKP